MTTTNRRDFIKGAGVVGGGLLMGVAVPGLRNQVANAAGTVHTPNAWVHIGDDNSITILSAHSEMGQGVYTSLPMLVAEELNVDLAKIRVQIAPSNAAYVNALLGAQITGGSTSVRNSWEKLRVAGAQVREMLVQAAANRWGVPVSSLAAKDGVVSGGGKKATYGELAADAAKLPVPEKPAIKDPKDFRLVGTSHPRLDTPMKVFTKAVYGMDIELPGMVYASLEQCPVIGGTVKSLDATAAKALPGVIDVIGVPAGVAVVAKTYWQAKKAREALKIEWDEGSIAEISTDSMFASTRAAAANPAKLIPITAPVGNADAAISSAAKVIKAEYTLPNQAHAPMEPMNFTADWNNGKPIVIGPTQFQQGAAGATAAALGVKPEDITVQTTFLGGGFGRRLELDFIVQAAQISKQVGKPVKLIWTREDDFTHDFYRPIALNQLQAGVDKDGNPVGLKFQVTSQSVTQRAFGLPKDTLDPFMAEAAVAPYGIANTQHDLVIHDTGFRVGYWRAVSHNMNAFANESFIDELAANAGKDPYEFRINLLAGKPRFANVLRTAASAAGWGTPLPAGHARGIALMEGYDTFMAQVAEVSVDAGKVRVHRVTVAADLGHLVNPNIVEAQIIGAVIFGLGTALKSKITVAKGRVQQRNFNTFQVIRANETPQIDVVLINSTEKPGGIGEPATALIGPAVANAVFAAVGKRVRTLPITAEELARA